MANKTTTSFRGSRINTLHPAAASSSSCLPGWPNTIIPFGLSRSPSSTSHRIENDIWILPQYIGASQQQLRNHPACCPDWRSTTSFSESDRHETSHRSSQQMGAQLYRPQRAACLHRADQKTCRSKRRRQRPIASHHCGDATRSTLDLVSQQQSKLDSRREVQIRLSKILPATAILYPS
uniref:Uncharacterized protein n=1 Tax=Glossina palpalis gambiensis TaxID=67801 RepID=A0A1B0BV03_9MUSC